MLTRIFGLGAMCAAGLLACSSSSSSGGGGSVTVTGTVGGQSVSAEDAVSLFQTQTSNGVTISTATIIIANVSGICSYAQRNVSPPSINGLVLSVGGTGPVVAGTYTVGASTTMLGEGIYSTSSATCTTTSSESAVSGTITVTAVSTSSIAGSFDIMLQGTSGNDHLTGSFTAPLCSVPMTDGGPASTCSK